MKNKLIRAINAIACVGGAVYAVSMVYGVWTEGLTAMGPWLLLGCFLGGAAMVVSIRRINRETDQILANMEAITARTNNITR